MTQQNPRELAKIGDPKAIAAILNRQLKPQGIDAQVMRDNGTLQITLESAKVLPQHALVDFIRNGMEKLGVESIYLIKVYGRQTGEDSPVWEDEIDMMPADSLLFPNEGPMSRDPIDMDDDMDIRERESMNYGQDSDYDLDGPMDEEEEVEHEEGASEDEEEAYDDEEAPPVKKKIPILPIALGAILVPVAVLAGLFFTGTGPFTKASDPAPETAASPKKPASPKPKASASPAKPAATPGNKPASPTTVASNATKASPPATATPTPKAVVSPVSPAPQSPPPSPTAPSATPSPVASPTPSAAPSPATSPTPAKPSPTPSVEASPASPAPRPLVPASSAWRDAVNSAQTAANLARTAQSKSEWDTVTNEWQKAVQLMKAVPVGNPNYQKAQQKAVEYQANLAVAQKRAAASE